MLRAPFLRTLRSIPLPSPHARTVAALALALPLALAACDDGGGTEPTANTGGDPGTGGSGGSGADGGGENTGGAGENTGGAGGTSSGGSGGGGTTTTSAAECTPGDTETCYTGPAGTLDVGVCKAGERTCSDKGTWGLCLGQITPLVETCETPADEDCDGQANESGNLCVCAPGAVEPCYTGPMGTQDVGLCKGGTWTCSDDGLAYGACEGQVVPALENCLLAEDEDCDGEALACTGAFAWQKKFGDAAAQNAAGVAPWAGGAVVVGTFAGTIDLGGGALASAGGNDVFVASFDYLGAHVWSRRFGDGLAQNGRAIAVDPAGNVVVVGDYAGTIDPGGGTLNTAGGTDLFVAKYAADGTFLWAKSFGGAQTQGANAVATDADGRIAITGAFAGSVGFGGDLLPSGGGNDIYLAVLDEDGNHLWSKRFGDSAAQLGKAVAFGPAGEVVVAGDNSGTVDFGAGAHTTAGASDVVLASFDKDGTPLWSRQFGNNVAQVANGLALDSAGNVVLAITFSGNVNFGGGALNSAGGNDIGIAKFTTGGMLLWGKRFGANGADNARGVAVDPFDAVVLAADYAGSVDFGGGALPSAGSTDAVVVKLAPTGDHVWSKRAGDNQAQTSAGVAADASGVTVTGSFAGAIDFGGGALTTAGANDVFLARLAP